MQTYIYHTWPDSTSLHTQSEFVFFMNNLHNFSHIFQLLSLQMFCNAKLNLDQIKSRYFVYKRHKIVIRLERLSMIRLNCLSNVRYLVVYNKSTEYSVAHTSKFIKKPTERPKNSVNSRPPQSLQHRDNGKKTNAWLLAWHASWPQSKNRLQLTDKTSYRRVFKQKQKCAL